MPVDVVNGTPIAYDEAGTGETVVLVHGSWNQRQAWGFVVPPLADSFRVVTYDRRGHGDSEARPDAGTVHDDVADLAALIETLHAAPAYVAGNSFGACIALRLAADRPALVKKVVAHEPPFIDLLDASPDTRPMVQATKRELDEVRARLEAGDHAGAAEYFVEHVASVRARGRRCLRRCNKASLPTPRPISVSWPIPMRPRLIRQHSP